MFVSSDQNESLSSLNVTLKINRIKKTTSEMNFFSSNNEKRCVKGISNLCQVDILRFSLNKLCDFVSIMLTLSSRLFSLAKKN